MLCQSCFPSCLCYITRVFRCEKDLDLSLKGEDLLAKYPLFLRKMILKTTSLELDLASSPVALRWHF